MKKDKKKFPKAGTPGVVDFGDGRKAHFIYPKFGRWRHYQMLKGLELAAMKQGQPGLWADTETQLMETVVRDCVVKLEGFADDDGALVTSGDLIDRWADSNDFLVIQARIFDGTPLGEVEKKTSAKRSASSEAGTAQSTGTTGTESSDPKEGAAPAA